MKLLSFSEIIWDVYPEEAVIGGSGLNFCAHAVRCGLEGYMLSAVGNDALGDRALEEMCRLGLRTELVRRDTHETGKCLVSLDASGNPSFRVLTDTAYDNIRLTGADLAQIREEHFDALYFGTLQQRGEVSRQTLRRLLSACRFPHVFCDVNLRAGCYDEASVRTVLENATVLKISEEEKPLLDAFPFWKEHCGGADFADVLFRAYPQLRTVLYTRGAEGSRIFLRGREAITVAAKPVRAVSAVGAGDSYGAAYLSGTLRGMSPREAGMLASAVSARVVSVREAVPYYTPETL